MQEGGSGEKEIQTSLQSVRGEIVVSEAELQSREGVRRIIKKYQNRVAEMLRLIQRQKKQNQSLRGEFRLLNDQLNAALKKAQVRPREEEPRGADPRAQITRKQLENEVKKNSILRKELEQFRYKFQYLNGQQIDALKNQLKDRDRTIDELQAQIRLFQKLDKQEKNADSYRKEEELNHKIMQLGEEVIHLKKKTHQQKKKEEELEKTLKTYRQQIASLQTKLAGRPPAEDRPKDKSNQLPTKQQVQKLKEKLKHLQNAKKMSDKSSKHQIDSLNAKLRSSERQLNQFRETIARKEKESSIILFRLKEKERKHFSTLEPIKTARYSQQVLHNCSGGLFQTRKDFRGLTWGQGIYREFDDSSQLPVEKNYRIKRLTFTFFEEHILSLATEYQLLDGEGGRGKERESKVLESFSIPTQYANIRTAQYTFGDYQYIAHMELYCGKGIEFLRIITSKEHSLEVGNPRSLPKCRQHLFDIASHEKPIAVMGIIQNRKLGSENREYFVNMGLQLRRKEVFIRGKPKRGDSSLNRSLLARSHNDKNG